MGRRRKYNGDTRSVSIRLDAAEQEVLNEVMEDLGYKSASDVLRHCFHDYLSFYFNHSNKEERNDTGNNA